MHAVNKNIYVCIKYCKALRCDLWVR